MDEIFDKWNKIKKQINKTVFDISIPFPKNREVWICSIGHNVGVEQNGSEDNFSRPVLVVKKFNNQMFWIVPLSTKQKSYDFYFNFTDPDGKKVSLVLAQLKLVSIKRFKRKIYEISIKEFDEIKSKIVKFVE